MSCRVASSTFHASRRVPPGSKSQFIDIRPCVRSEFTYSTGEKHEKLLVQMFEGHYFGELALIYGEPRNASVRATDEASPVFS